MQTNLKTNTVVVIVAGIPYYYVFSNLVVIGAAIAAPDWFVPFMQEHQVLGLNLMTLATTVPLVAVGAAIMAYGLAKIFDGKYFVYGLLIVGVMIVFATLVTDYGLGFWRGLRMNALPHPTAIPMFFAVWLFLPLAMLFFGRRKDRGRKRVVYS